MIDDLSTGRWENLDHLKDNPRLKFIVASLPQTRKSLNERSHGITSFITWPVPWASS